MPTPTRRALPSLALAGVAATATAAGKVGTSGMPPIERVQAAAHEALPRHPAANRALGRTGTFLTIKQPVKACQAAANR